MATPNLQSAPMTPSEVSVLVENNKLVFRTDDGHWVYVSDADKPGLSACDGDCLKKWQPIYLRGGARPIGDWTVVTRKDGKQWAYKGRPVYVSTQAINLPANAEPGWHPLNP